MLWLRSSEVSFKSLCLCSWRRERIVKAGFVLVTLLFMFMISFSRIVMHFVSKNFRIVDFSLFDDFFGMLHISNLVCVRFIMTQFKIPNQIKTKTAGTHLAIWNSAKIIFKVLGSLKKVYLKFDKIAVFHNFLIFYVIPKNFGPMLTEVWWCTDVNDFNSGALKTKWKIKKMMSKALTLFNTF